MIGLEIIDPNMPGQQVPVPARTCIVDTKKQGECDGENWVHERGCKKWSCLLNNEH